jgi:hypothetical protein
MSVNVLFRRRTSPHEEGYCQTAYIACNLDVANNGCHFRFGPCIIIHLNLTFRPQPIPVSNKPFLPSLLNTVPTQINQLDATISQGLLLEVYLQLNMFRTSSRPSSGVQQLQ